MDQKLVDRIYECAFAPEFWPIALHELAQVADARGGLLFAANAEVGVLRWTASQHLERELARYVSEGWLERDRRRDRVIGLSHAGFVTDHDVYKDEEIAADPVYSEFLIPAGLGWAAGTAISPGTGDAEPAVIRQLDELRSHLARSAMMSVRLNMERARVAGETLGLIGLPALVFDERGKILAANHLVESLDEYLQWRAQDRVVLKDTRANTLFQQAIATIGAADATPVRSFALRVNDAKPLVVHVVPIRGVAQDIFVRCAGVLVMTPVNLPPAPTIELIQSLFDHRSLFPDAAAGAAQYCAPRLDHGYAVEEARRRIALRAHLLRAADGPRVGPLRGCVDAVNPRCIEGWAQNAENPEAPVCLDIYAGGRLIGQTLANQYREDLKRAGLGSGRHSFVFTPPAGLAFASNAVKVRRSLDGAALEFSAGARRACLPNRHSTKSAAR